MTDLETIIKSIRRTGDKDSKAYKVTEYYSDLTSGTLDDGRIALARSKIINIEKELINWSKEHPNNSTIMQPEESALVLINDLKDKGILKDEIKK